MTGTTKRQGVTARAATPKAFRAKVVRGRVLITLPKLGKARRIEIQRSAATKKATFARIGTSRRGRTSTAPSTAGAGTGTASSS